MMQSGATLDQNRINTGAPESANQNQVIDNLENVTNMYQNNSMVNNISGLREQRSTGSSNNGAIDAYGGNSQSMMDQTFHR